MSSNAHEYMMVYGSMNMENRLLGTNESFEFEK